MGYLVLRLRFVENGGVEAISLVTSGQAPEFAFELQTGVRGQNLAHDIFIFFGFERTGCVHESPPGREASDALSSDLSLLRAEPRNIFASDAPLDFRVPRKSSGAGTGGIDEDAIEGGIER